jgi:hypothetical protein
MKDDDVLVESHWEEKAFGDCIEVRFKPYDDYSNYILYKETGGDRDPRSELWRDSHSNWHKLVLEFCGHINESMTREKARDMWRGLQYWCGFRSRQYEVSNK